MDKSSKLNISVILFKLTKKCNATCTHCAAIKNQKYRLSLNKAKEIIDKIAKYVIFKCNIIFHGGEPMLIEPEYYAKLIDYINKNYPGKFYYSMQSNFLLYNDEWQELLEKYNIRISTSYDFFSDIRNINGDTKLYYDIWYKNIKTFQEKMSKKENRQFFPFIINIITKENKDKAKEIYEISKKENFHMRYNHFYKVGRAEKNYQKYYITVEEYYQFLKEIFDLYITDIKNNNVNKKFLITPFDKYISILINRKFDGNKKYGVCPWMNTCGGTFLNVEPNGELYNCAEMSDIDLYSYGNIFEINDLIEITKTENFKKIYNRRFKLPLECLKCKHFDVCQGGCMRSAYLQENNIYGKPWTCYSNYHIIELIKENLDILLNYIYK